MRHRARCVDHRGAAAFELDQRDAVVDVAAFAQALVHGDRPVAKTRSAFGAPSIQRTMSVSCTLMSTKIPAALRREAHEEAGRIVHVGGLRADQEGRPISPCSIFACASS
jgi:hypothetical protein